LPCHGSALLVVDFQQKLMPAIDGAAAAVANARRLMAAADLLGVPVLLTEQNARGLGPTVPELAGGGHTVFPKMSFDACRAPGFRDVLPGRPDIVVAGCEAHVCVLQTVLGLLDLGRRVHLVVDAVASRRPLSKDTALHRLDRQGAQLVTTEMVLFEWLGNAEHPRFRDVLALVKEV
jgi:nicotinamidase-related amidase